MAKGSRHSGVGFLPHQPTPITAEQEKKLIETIQRHTKLAQQARTSKSREKARTIVRDAREKLLIAHGGWLRKYCSKPFCGHIPYEDKFQIGLMAYMEAAVRFDTSKGFRFLTYASYWVRHYLQDASIKYMIVPHKTRKESLQQGARGVCVTESSLNNESGRPIKLSDLIAIDGDEEERQNTIKEMLRQARTVLTRREQIIMLRLRRYTVQQIAKQLGTKPGCVGTHRYNAIKKLKAIIARIKNEDK